MQAKKERKPLKVKTGAVTPAPVRADGYKPKPCFTVETDAGKVFIRIHEADYVSMESFSHYCASTMAGRRYETDEDRASAQSLTIRGVAYTASASYRGPVGEDLDRARLDYFSAHRTGGFKIDAVSYPARDALRDVFLAALAALYAEVGSTPFAIADALQAQDEATEAAEKVEEAEKALRKAKEESALAAAKFGERVQAVERRGIKFAPWSREAEGGAK